MIQAQCKISVYAAATLKSYQSKIMLLQQFCHIFDFVSFLLYVYEWFMIAIHSLYCHVCKNIRLEPVAALEAAVFHVQFY